jgi:hypothetical protein
VFDIISENYPYSGRNANSRLALDVTLVHGTKFLNDSISSVKTPDDEYTPSVFTTYTYRIHDDTSKGGFAQWKPITYQSSGRKSSESQQVTIVPTAGVDECDTEVPSGLASAVFGNASKNVTLNMTRWFVVFGTPGDDNYINSTYNTW